MFFGWLMLFAMLSGAYFYGVKVGLRAGRAAGRKTADAEWALRLEHGAVAAPMPRDAGMFAPSELERWA